MGPEFFEFVGFVLILAFALYGVIKFFESGGK